MPAQVRCDHAAAAGREHGRDLDVAVDVIREAVQEQHGPPVSRTHLVETDIQNAGLDLLKRRERLRYLGLPAAGRRLSHPC
jgi:hypothetical protein